MRKNRIVLPVVLPQGGSDMKRQQIPAIRMSGSQKGTGFRIFFRTAYSWDGIINRNATAIRTSDQKILSPDILKNQILGRIIPAMSEKMVAVIAAGSFFLQGHY